MRYIFIFLLLVLGDQLFAQTDKYKKADSLYNVGLYNQVVDTCSAQLMKLKDTDALYTKFLKLRVSCYRELGNFELGIIDCDHLIKLNSGDIGNYVMISYLYGNVNKFTDAISYLKTALKIDSNNIGIINNLSYYYNQVADFSSAIFYSNKGLSTTKNPQWKSSLLNNRGYAYMMLQQNDRALADINASIISNPDNSFAYCYRALVNIRLKNIITVCKDLNTAKSLGATSLTKDLIKRYCAN